MSADPIPANRPLARRLLGFNLLSAVVLAAAGYYLGWWLGHQINATSLNYFSDTGQNDVAALPRRTSSPCSASSSDSASSTTPRRG